MRKFVERNLAAIIVAIVFAVAFSSCGSTKKLKEKPIKECCKKTAQAVYEYEGLIVE
tara:strand:- start:744 stop:914 length:171 start_codon:yes stop_codon:yes gene_type:complete